MSANLFLSHSELHRYTDSTNWDDKAYALLLQQEESWDLLEKNYAGLSNVESKDFEIEGSTYRVQFNPGRIVSSSAKVDEQSIRERKCFLCPANLPQAQRGLEYNNDYIILCNPFPIFREHFTIVHREHIPQRIEKSFPTLLKLSKDLAERYIVLYNGPSCGASAPDHLHFQAGEKGFMPIEEEYEQLITGSGEKIADVNGLLAFAVGDFRRRFVSFESDEGELLQKAFTAFFRAMHDVSATSDEPRINVLSSYQDGEWRVVIFPRAKHRPSFFFEEGEKKMLVSPAAVDFGGVITTPIEKDFRHITKEHVMQVFDEVAFSQPHFDALKSKLLLNFSHLKS